MENSNGHAALEPIKRQLLVFPGVEVLIFPSINLNKTSESVKDHPSVAIHK